MERELWKNKQIDIKNHFSMEITIISFCKSTLLIWIEEPKRLSHKFELFH